MKITKLLAPAVLLCAFNLNAHAQWFVRSDITRLDISWEGYSNATGVSVTAGRTFGSRGQHELSLQLDYAKWKFNDTDGYVTVGGSDKYTPTLLNYRYHVWGTDQFKNVQFYMGPAVGFTYEKVDYNLTGSGVRLSGDDSDWLFTWSGSAGFLIPVTRQVEIDLGYRYLHFEGGEFTIAGSRISTGSAHAHVFYGGVGVKF